MDLSNASVWWIAAGVAVAAELATGTFYLGSGILLLLR